MSAYEAYLRKSAALTQVREIGTLLQEVLQEARSSWPNIQRAGKSVASMAGEHGPKVEKGLDVLHRLVGGTVAAQQGIDRTARGVERAVKPVHALRQLVEDASQIHGRLTEQRNPHPAIPAGVGLGAGIAAALAYNRLKQEEPYDTV